MRVVRARGSEGKRERQRARERERANQRERKRMRGEKEQEEGREDDGLTGERARAPCGERGTHTDCLKMGGEGKV